MYEVMLFVWALGTMYAFGLQSAVTDTLKEAGRPGKYNALEHLLVIAFVWPFLLGYWRALYDIDNIKP